MPLLVSCSCGKKLRVKDELAGKRIKCPACGNVFSIPAEPEPVEPELVEEPSPAPVKRAPKPPPLAGAKAAPPAAHDEPVQEEETEATFWECRREFSNGLLVLTDDAIWFGKLADKELKRAKKQLAQGESPDDVLDEKAVQGRLRFADILEISFNKRHKQITAKYPSGDDKENANFYFEDYATRDEVFKDMRRRLGSAWEYKRRDLSPLQAMLSPLAVIGILVLVFGFLVFLAWSFNQPREGGGRVRTNIWGLLIAYTVGWLGPIWTGVIGGVGVLLTFVWMGFRMADPPIEISLKPKSEKEAAEEEEEDEEDEDDRPKRKSRRRPRDEEDE